MNDCRPRPRCPDPLNLDDVERVDPDSLHRRRTPSRPPTAAQVDGLTSLQRVDAELYS
jgi:hypothetical protein